MAIYKCIIDCLYNHINNKAILKFQRKKIILEAQESLSEGDASEVIVEEDSPDSRLKKLIIKSKQTSLKDGIYPNSTFICLDQKDENLSCFTHFVKSESKGLRQKCDFAFVYKYGNTTHIVISELKSSRKGVNSRCHGQFSRSKVFLKYIFNLIGEIEEINSSINFIFYKAVFIPSVNLAIATSEPITPDAKEKEKLPRLIRNNYAVFELETDPEGVAVMDIELLVAAIPKSSAKIPVRQPTPKPRIRLIKKHLNRLRD